MPKGESAAAQLRAMATNYAAGHNWDKLDARACIRGALEIEALRALLAAAPAHPAEGVPTSSDLRERLARLEAGCNAHTTPTVYEAIADSKAALDELDEARQRVGISLAATQPAAQAVQPVAPQLKANCYSDDNGDYWRDCPDDCDFVEGLKVGDTYELQASIRAWSETFRVTKAPDETSDDYEVELVSSDAPAHPAEGVPAQCPNINEPRGCWRVACQLGGKCREPELAATQPAAQAVQPFGWLITKSKLPGDMEFTQDPIRENLARSFGYQTQALYDQPAAQGMEADLADEQIDETFNQMPDGAAGFLKSWGYRQFARAVLAAQAKQGGAA